MGHYASEMDSSWGDSVEWSDKCWALKKRLADVPLSQFKAQDIPALTKLFGICPPDINQEQYDRLNKVARRHKLA